MENLKVQSRCKKISHEARKCRKKGMVPGVLYGKNINNLLFEISELELNSAISREGEHGVVNVDFGGENYDTLIKEVQRDPVNRKIIHIDLEKIEANKKITSSVPIHYIGEDLINRNGTILQKDRDSVKVQCEISELPKYINIDVTSVNVGDQIRVSDVEFAKELFVVDDLNTVLASVSYEQKIPEDIDLEPAVNENQKKQDKK
ncbi:50S ribosomal protein L25 [Clostridium tarantellae]|uniref:Large ribosomal subunit protein bL25 n=1 Tax=Clostridium tarantellae TaxID=39493 RepID=A0A6I1MN96_9CLOT|nr:50S ribosomal protein L25 [Clostridium tarantellae]MPQ44233.1 50S ribosomal protein L25 [Clostridium tarantellae]